MANKKENIVDAILMSILEILNNGQSGMAAATAVNAMTDIKKDGVDQKDIHNIAANSIFDQNTDPQSKIEFILQNNPDVIKTLDDYLKKKNIILNSLDDLNFAIQSYFSDNKKFGEGGQFDDIDNTIDVEINGKTYTLLHLKSESEKELGLSNVESMEDNEGALFDYSDEPQPEMSFWMKDTTIPLKICFINEDGIVISVHNAKPLSEDLITESSEFVAYVIEVNQGENINPGDETSLGYQNIQDDKELSVNRLYVYGSDGEVQAELLGGERIFSRISSKVIIRKAKKAFASREDKDYKALGRYIFREMDAQDNRKPEYVNT